VVAAVLADPRTAPVTARDRQLYLTVEAWTSGRQHQDPAVLDAAQCAGWSAEELFEASTVCALFCFYNAWVTNSGVEELSAEAYRASGRRLAERGYVAD
jgi:hypothetical protein